MKTITVMSLKGGSGKTTVAVSLAITAHLLGLKTKLCDADPQRSASLSLGSRQGDGPAFQTSMPGTLYQNGVIAAREGFMLRVIDTPAAPRVDVVQAASCADLCLVVCRPTFLDIASVLQSAELIKQLGKVAAVVLNQTPPARGDIDPPAVRKAIEALTLTGLPLAGVIRSRLAYQHSLAYGRSAAEDGSDQVARELNVLWATAQRLLSAGSISASRPSTAVVA